ncbi:polysaccharide export protein [Rhizobium sp. VS19-DR104.2]|uniref:polysaccharide biosynthesis/export family protein n=1 Tax=unclassified Rhizobium TaxID=2613769 RepID=UPI001CC4597E|nr:MULTISPECIES: polysaccharide biosynthesis/export family protein [unclassified Rhizobium]MBZ5762965.1 polysaccharide export protein [Rhizobium sp. VS19-DR96]MBZ5768798.1 polysaccharide export protein [Rhizobium sp. VS19-DR129.2]MBZ5776414.1 polysaccharide export protein [Rhizobium sp. VS19-DRK62.2]MBZ5787621.1 polysaccharide export protein [Rhizobium sp. VS19-DR121]MBZ5804976.1 polysaccharide export protein [Rhizobium sp. VS19-DR181]
MRSAVWERATSNVLLLCQPLRQLRITPTWRLLLGSIFGLAILSGYSALAEDYILGPQDKLKIRVFEWRPVTGTAFEWVPLNGEFVISAAGTLSLPIVGVVPASGLTVDQISDSIGERLKNQVGMQKRPNASVEVSEYRPFFIAGLVTKPGKYAYSPGLTVVQALSMAGGMTGPVDVNVMGLQRDVLTMRGDLRALNIERFGLLARQARVDAIINNQPSVVFPPELTTHSGQAIVDRIMKEEADLFDTRQRSISAEIVALNEARVLASNQIEALQSKATSLAKQIDLASKDLGTVNKLVSAGLSVSARSLGASQNLADLESRSLDVSLANLKAQQDVAKVDRDITDLRNRYRVDALTEAADVRAKIGANAEKVQTTRALLDNIALQAPMVANSAVEDGLQSFETTIDRLVSGHTRTLAVGDNDAVEPGDLIRVEKLPETNLGAPQTNSRRPGPSDQKRDGF